MNPITATATLAPGVSHSYCNGVDDRRWPRMIEVPVSSLRSALLAVSSQTPLLV